MFDSAALRTLRERLHALLKAPSHRGRPRQSRYRDPLPADLSEVAERIWYGVFHDDPGRPDFDRLIRVALQHLQDDLHSGRAPEVLEEIRREIAYRNWRAEAVHGKKQSYPGEPS